MSALAQIAFNFAYQSYFDSTLLGAAILPQAPGQAIVASTRTIAQVRGVRIGLAGNSGCPIAIRFTGKSSSGAVILTPGMAIEPGAFEGFEYGLPFGWLGGGVGALLVAESGAATFAMGPTRNEVIFHRTRLQVQAAGAVVAPGVSQNWPGTFPWAHSTSAGLNQNSSPSILVRPTKTILRYNGALSADTPVRIYGWGSTDFSDGVSTYVFADVVFPGTTDVNNTPYSLAELPDAFQRLDFSNGGVLAYSLGLASLVGNFIDVIRYGEI